MTAFDRVPGALAPQLYGFDVVGDPLVPLGNILLVRNAFEFALDLFLAEIRSQVRAGLQAAFPDLVLPGR